MALVEYAGQNPAPAWRPTTRHERKWEDIIEPAVRTQLALNELNWRGMDTLRKRGMPEAVREIVKQVAKSRRVTVMLIASASRMQVAVDARNEAMYLIKARNPKKTSASQIARWFARDHTSCLHGIASHQDRHNLPKLVGYDIARVRERNAEISARMRQSGALG